MTALPLTHLLRALLATWVLIGAVACSAVRIAPLSTDASATSNKGPQAGPSPADEEVDEYAEVAAHDPLEGMNRAVFKFNDALYTVLLRPVAKGYQVIFPKPVREGIGNVFDNARFPVRFVNATLQGKFERSGQEVGMFLVNSVGGVGGLFRVSNHIPALSDVPAEDTGQTLATWGLRSGPYLVLPVLGPSSVRDGLGEAADYALNPVNWGLFWSNAPSWTDIPPVVNTVQSLPGRLETYDLAVGNSVDPYLSARSSYLQNRVHKSAR